MNSKYTNKDATRMDQSKFDSLEIASAILISIASLVRHRTYLGISIQDANAVGTTGDCKSRNSFLDTQRQNCLVIDDIREPDN